VALLYLVPLLWPAESSLLVRLRARLEQTFTCEVVARTPRFDPEASFDSSRGQYNSTGLLESLLDEPSAAGSRILGVASVDLFIPILTFVFGEAQLGGRAAVVSTYRLDNAHYGLPDNEALLLERLAKEANHELGHTHGLIHCADTTCVMHSSTYVEDIDVKSARFCSACLPAIRVGR
jgi:archaemetzincin